MIDITALPNRVIPLGRLGENEHRRIMFDISEYQAQYPSATYTLLNRLPNSATAYPVVGTSVSGTSLYWLVSSTDLAADGQGQCELLVIEGDVVAKSVIYVTMILPALDGSGDPPSEWESWQTVFSGYKTDAEAAAADAEAAAQAAQAAGIPTGGTTGQVLGKVSDTDRDVAWIDQTGGGGGGGGGGTTDYTALSNKPQIAGVTLTGNKSLTDLGIAAAADIPTLNYVTPEDYGAVGDGTTDDSQAVQDACDAGYNVYFGSGKTYYLASTVTIDHDCHLYGGEGATIKTATPSGGSAYNGIVVAGTLKKTTTLTTDYTSNGTTDNSNNRFTLTDMTDIAIGDIMVIEATDQYYNYNRQYYYLGGTLLITDIYDGHIYTADSMPWDITSSANVTVTVYDAPTAIIENLRFESNGYFSGNYRYLLVLSMTKGSDVNNCTFTQMCSGIHIESCVNAKADNVLLSKSKYDNSLSGTGYGIVVNACSNTVIERVIATCAQHAITITGYLPSVNVYIRDSYISSECRVPGLDTHENVYNLVVEDCALGTASLNAVCTLNRCRIINNRRIDNESQGLSIYGSHRSDWSRIKILNTVFDGTYISLPMPSVETPIQAYDHVYGSIEIRDCIGGYLSYCPNTSEYILSNTVNRLVIDNWQNVDQIYRAVGNSSVIKELVISDTTFNDWNFLGDDWTSHGIILDGIEYFSWDNKLMPLNKSMVNRTSRGECCVLPEGVPIQLSSSNASAVFRICGANLTPDNVDDLLLGSVSGNTGSALVRTAGSNAGTISFDSDGNLIYSQASNTNTVDIYSVGMCRVNDWSVATLSATLKNTGTTDGAKFRFYIAVVDGDTGYVVERRSTSAIQATESGVTLQHDSYIIKPGDLVLHYIYCATPVSGAITTFENLSMTITPRFAAPVVNDTYTAKRRTGDGTLTSLAGVNNIMCSEDTFTVSLTADLNANPVGLLPTATGVSF